MSRRRIAAIAAVAAAAMTTSGAMTREASAQDVKVGLILPYTGVGAELANKWIAASISISS